MGASNQSKITSALLCVCAMSASAFAESLEVDLSHHSIAIHSNFTGAEVLLFGAMQGSGGGEIVAVLRGPNQPVVVRRKARFYYLPDPRALYTFQGTISLFLFFLIFFTFLSFVLVLKKTEIDLLTMIHR